MTDHTCSYYCDQPECIRSQRDFLRDLAEKNAALQPVRSIAVEETQAGVGKAAAVSAEKDAEIARLGEDASRYHFLRNDFSVSSPNMGGNHAWVYRRNFSLKGPTLDAAIDAARKETK